MTIDHTPAIRAFVQERLKIYNRKEYEDKLRAIDELEIILAVCDGLQKQNNTLATAYAEANIPIWQKPF